MGNVYLNMRGEAAGLRRAAGLRNLRATRPPRDARRARVIPDTQKPDFDFAWSPR